MVEVAVFCVDDAESILLFSGLAIVLLQTCKYKRMCVARRIGALYNRRATGSMYCAGSMHDYVWLRSAVKGQGAGRMAHGCVWLRSAAISMKLWQRVMNNKCSSARTHRDAQSNRGVSIAGKPR